jgi:hypothetical protein
VRERNSAVEQGLTGEEERVDVLAVVAEGHALLAQADGVLPGGDAVEPFEVSLVDASQGRVDLDRVCVRERSVLGSREVAERVWVQAVSSGAFEREAWHARIPTF